MWAFHASNWNLSMTRKAGGWPKTSPPRPTARSGLSPAACASSTTAGTSSRNTARLARRPPRSPSRRATPGASTSRQRCKARGGVGGLLSSTVLNGGSYVPCFPAYDGNGNISAWIDAAGGVLERMDYSPFGKLVTCQKFGSSGVLSRLNFGFSTKFTDSESGLLYYGYRFYDPVTGRWPSRDPIGEDGGVNLYGFVGNNGVMAVDRFGLEAYVLLYAAHDAKNTGMFESWAKTIEVNIRNRKKTDFDTDFRCFDSQSDTIHLIKVESLDDLERLRAIRDVRYVGSFGDGRDDTFWYLNSKGGSSAVAADGATMKSKSSASINLKEFTSMINWADACKSCCDAGLAFELYHCETNVGGDSIRDQLDDALNHRNLDSDGFGPIPNPQRDVFVGGFSAGVSNGIGWPGSQIGWRGWPRPNRESKKRVLNPNCSSNQGEKHR